MPNVVPVLKFYVGEVKGAPHGLQPGGSFNQDMLHKFARLRAPATRALHNFGSSYVAADDALRLAWREEYAATGCLTLKGALDEADVSALKGELVKVAKGEYGEVGGRVEPEPGADDDAITASYLAFHHPHKLSPVLKQAMFHPAIADVLTSVIGPNVKTMQSMFFSKAPGKPGQAWHQDELYIPTRDRSLIGAWIAIDDATVDNGCLWIHPGSHEPGVLYRMEQHNDPRFDPAGESQDFPYDAEGGVPAEVPSGSVVFFNGYTLHRSLPNKSNRFRRAYVIHYMSAESLLPWNCDGTVDDTPDNRDIIMVAGEDPYAYKGITDDLTFPFVRPDKGTVGADATKGAAAVRPNAKFDF